MVGKLEIAGVLGLSFVDRSEGPNGFFQVVSLGHCATFVAFQNKKNLPQTQKERPEFAYRNSLKVWPFERGKDHKFFKLFEGRGTYPLEPQESILKTHKLGAFFFNKISPVSDFNQISPVSDFKNIFPVSDFKKRWGIGKHMEHIGVYFVLCGRFNI